MIRIRIEIDKIWSKNIHSLSEIFVPRSVEYCQNLHTSMQFELVWFTSNIFDLRNIKIRTYSILRTRANIYNRLQENIAYGRNYLYSSGKNIFLNSSSIEFDKQLLRNRGKTNSLSISANNHRQLVVYVITMVK